VDFMVIALPRSRTTWLANFLTTEKTFCYHDPLAEMSSYKELLGLKTDRLTGIADTGIGFFDLSIFDCPKVIIERDLSAVNEEMSDLLGISIDMSDLNNRMASIEGLRIKFEDINDRLEEIWKHCTGLPFDRLRGDYLKNMNIQVKDLPIDEVRLSSLRSEIKDMPHV
jgi:hypothetical protein